MIGNLDSRLNNLLAMLGLGPLNGRGGDVRELEHYLEILRDAPTPDLSAGKRRLLAEAARLQLAEPVVPHSTPATRRMPLIAGAWAGMTVVVLLVAVTILFAYNLPSGSSTWGIWGSGTIASTQAPSSETASIATEGPSATTGPTPVQTRGFQSIAPAATPQPAVAPLPVHGPSLTLTRTAP